MANSVEIATPLRLHFGLFSFGGSGRQFGGVGAMAGLSGPRVRLTAAKQLEAVGPLAERALGFARRWGQWQGLLEDPHCRIEVLSTPPEHTGLGVGTQLALAMGAGSNVLFEKPSLSPAELAVCMGRGLRSAVGTYGFAMGGLVVEQGKLPGEVVSPLDFQLDLPSAWRFALIRPRAAQGLAGRAEQQAFAELPPVPESVTQRLVAEVRDRLTPAAAQGRFDDFSDSLYEFGHAAGLCFAAKQGGAYNGPLLTALVAEIRALGVCGVGQSSWGPTLFALLPDEAYFDELSRRLTEKFPFADLAFEIAPPNNGGAKITRISANTLSTEKWLAET